jgi:hypothetical protein
MYSVTLLSQADLPAPSFATRRIFLKYISRAFEHLRMEGAGRARETLEDTLVSVVHSTRARVPLRHVLEKQGSILSAHNRNAPTLRKEYGIVVRACKRKTGKRVRKHVVAVKRASARRLTKSR